MLLKLGSLLVNSLRGHNHHHHHRQHHHQVKIHDLGLDRDLAWPFFSTSINLPRSFLNSMAVSSTCFRAFFSRNFCVCLNNSSWSCSLIHFLIMMYSVSYGPTLLASVFHSHGAEQATVSNSQGSSNSLRVSTLIYLRWTLM